MSLRREMSLDSGAQPVRRLSLRREMSMDSDASSAPTAAEKSFLGDPGGFKAAFVASVVGDGAFSRSEMAPHSRARRGSMPNLGADLPGSVPRVPDLVADLPGTSSLLQHPAASDGSERAPRARARRGSMPNLFADLPFDSLQQLPAASGAPRVGRRMSYQPLQSIESFLANPPKAEPKPLVRDDRSGPACPNCCGVSPRHRRDAPAPLRCPVHPVTRRRGMAAWLHHSSLSQDEACSNTRRLSRLRLPCFSLSAPLPGPAEMQASRTPRRDELTGLGREREPSTPPAQSANTPASGLICDLVGLTCLHAGWQRGQLLRRRHHLRAAGEGQHHVVSPRGTQREREFFIDNLLVRTHCIIEMIWWTGLAPWEFEFPFPGRLISTFLEDVETLSKVRCDVSSTD